MIEDCQECEVERRAVFRVCNEEGVAEKYLCSYHYYEDSFVILHPEWIVRSYN